MNPIIYILSLFIAWFVIYLIKNDFKKLNEKLYNQLNNKIWIKLYSFASIVLMHLIWIFYTLFMGYKDETLLYAVPLYLLIPYTIYVLSIIMKDNANNIETVASDKINRILNILMTIYLTIIVIVIAIPNKIKSDIVEFVTNFIINFFNKYIYEKFIKK
jgi:hypothetical protein